MPEEMTLDRRLEGKVALVTGALLLDGLGREIARSLASAGATLFLSDTPDTADETENVLAYCRKVNPGLKAAVRIADLSERGAAVDVVRACEAEFGRLDILVNNAATRRNTGFGNYSRDDFRLVTEVNIASPFFASQEAFRIMKKQGGGRIIFLGSHYGIVAFDDRALYGLTKASAIFLARAIAEETAQHGIVANAISPGSIDTHRKALFRERDPDYDKKRFAEIPARRFGRKEEIAELALFLAADAPSYLNGQNIKVDGGSTIR